MPKKLNKFFLLIMVAFSTGSYAGVGDVNLFCKSRNYFSAEMTPPNDQQFTTGVEYHGCSVYPNTQGGDTDYAFVGCGDQPGDSCDNLKNKKAYTHYYSVDGGASWDLFPALPDFMSNVKVIHDGNKPFGQKVGTVCVYFVNTKLIDCWY